jgi:peptide-methionine (R)-S-oxide reductase
MLAALRRVARPAAVAVAAGGAAVIVAAVRGLGSGRREDSDEGPRAKSDADWFHVLTRDQFHVLRMGGTEHPFSGEYVQFSPAGGHFACAGCALPLYSAGSKFESSCGVRPC